MNYLTELYSLVCINEKHNSQLDLLVQVILELESPDPELVVHTVDEPDFTCGSSGTSLHQL